jgi:membrane-bound acyltransferase YfiQ involved in biofilm formation
VFHTLENTVIFHLFFMGLKCDHLNLREEHEQQAFNKKMLSNIFHFRGMKEVGNR